MVMMGTPETAAARPGLRERKKQQTRERIAEVALRLFAERGYDETTLADIADAADVSRRTIFAYYDSKEDILLCEEARYFNELKRRLEERPDGMTTVDAIRQFISTIGPPAHESHQRKQVLSANPALQAKLRARMAELEPMLAESVAKDLGAGPGDIRPLLIAASITAAFTSFRDRLMDAASDGEPLSHEEGMATLDQVLEFLRGGLEALQRD
jgi:AcrR family transcriptional regulator